MKNLQARIDDELEEKLADILRTKKMTKQEWILKMVIHEIDQNTINPTKITAFTNSSSEATPEFFAMSTQWRRFMAQNIMNGDFIKEFEDKYRGIGMDWHHILKIKAHNRLDQYLENPNSVVFQ